MAQVMEERQVPTPELVMQDREMFEMAMEWADQHGMGGLMWLANAGGPEMASAIMQAVKVARGRRRTEPGTRRSRRSAPPAS